MKFKLLISSTFICFYSFFCSAQALQLGEYCTEQQKTCIKLFQENRFEEIIRLDVNTISTGTYSLNNNILTFEYDTYPNEMKQHSEFTVIKTEADKIILRKQNVKNRGKKITFYKKTVY